MSTILSDKILIDTCPGLRLGVLLIQVRVLPSSDALLAEIKDALNLISADLSRENIASIPALHATRQAYKALGKDPSRYRPSAEALLRRVVSGKGLYRVNNVVDSLNLVSVQSGFSIGGYDFSKIDGNIRLGRGNANEPYEAIGRGSLNIEGLPVLRDESGAFGSSTSDSTRTMVTESTTTFLAVILDFGKNENLENALSNLTALLEKYALGKMLGKWILNSGDILNF